MDWLRRYEGARARNYDADRCHSLRWANEQRAVADMVFSGPVLDCPVGTGRYLSIYESKGLKVVGVDISRDMLAVAKSRYPNLDARQGSVFNLPFSDGHFETVVCTRLLDWLSPLEMVEVVAALRRVARTVIVTLRHGKEERRTNWTHKLSRFYEAVEGLFICDRRTTEVTRDGTEEIFRLRPPEWADVVKQFYYHGHTPAFEMYRLGAEWAEPFGFKPPIIAEDTVSVRAEYWTGDELGAVIDDMAEHVSSYRTKQPPRYPDGPATVLRTAGHVIVLDGRRRINRWRKTPGRYPVLVVDA